jgi:hypothetical protein
MDEKRKAFHMAIAENLESVGISHSGVDSETGLMVSWDNRKVKTWLTKERESLHVIFSIDDKTTASICMSIQASVHLVELIQIQLEKYHDEIFARLNKDMEHERC